MFRDLRCYLARVHENAVSSRPRIFLAAFIALLAVAGCKYGIIGLMLWGGMSRTELRVQDALTAGLLAAIVVWLALAAAHFRQKQIRDQVQTVADLNHHLRNALNIVLNSQYLSTHDQKDAVLASVDRIDRALQRIVPPDRSRGPASVPKRAPARDTQSQSDKSEMAGD